MSLRQRLWLTLGALFLVPLFVGALVLLVLVPDARSDRVGESVRTAAAAVTGQLRDDCRALGLAARATALEATTTGPEAAARGVVDGGYVDYAALLGATGAVVAESGRLGSGTATDLGSCATGGTGGGALAETVQVQGSDEAASVAVAQTLDRSDLRRLRGRAGIDGDVVLLDGREVVAATTAPDTARVIARVVADRRGNIEVDGWTLRATPPDQGTPYTVVIGVRDTSDGSQALLLTLIMLAGAVVAGVLVTVVVRGLSQPYTDLTVAAERVAQGDLDVPISGSDEGEAGRLGNALNHMTAELRRSLTELERSREDLRHSLERIGDALSSTHDLDGLLGVVLETAMATLDAKAGVVVYRGGDEYRLVAEQGLHEAGLTAPAVVASGRGVLGQVVAGGVPTRGRLGSGPVELTPDGTEPDTGDVLAVPLRTQQAVSGVVALYGRPFDDTDEDALTTLTGQAGIAIDNVHLHHEAERLSTTDPLTGLWNFRYLTMSLAREIERSMRFDRPLAVLMLDLDRFKTVNDSYGHPRGDTVLRELADRVLELIREVDTFARYGGEEFVVVLPETSVEGAVQLAERICAGVRREPFRQEDDEPLDITVSIGAAAFPDHGSTPATLMRAADKALYVAKREGRDRWQVAGS